MKQCHFKITGKVQGVWFRAAAQKEAERLGLKGVIQNMSDGSVELTLQGSEDSLDEFKDWCHKGSDASEPEHVEMTPQELGEEFSEITIQ
jgi:acylphosphatase